VKENPVASVSIVKTKNYQKDIVILLLEMIPRKKRFSFWETLKKYVKYWKIIRIEGVIHSLIWFVCSLLYHSSSIIPGQYQGSFWGDRSEIGSGTAEEGKESSYMKRHGFKKTPKVVLW